MTTVTVTVELNDTQVGFLRWYQATGRGGDPTAELARLASGAVDLLRRQYQRRGEYQVEDPGETNR